jgi:hypothetical protein
MRRLLSKTNHQQLHAAMRAGYRPYRLMDFRQDRVDAYVDPAHLFDRLRNQLMTKDPDAVKDGLSNVLYLFSQMGACERDEIFDFRERIRKSQLLETLRTFDDLQGPGLIRLHRLSLPGFNCMHRLSFLRRQLDANYIYLPKNLHAILRKRQGDFTRSLISEAHFERMCIRCREIAELMLEAKVSVGKAPKASFLPAMQDRVSPDHDLITAKVKMSRHPFYTAAQVAHGFCGMLVHCLEKQVKEIYVAC